MTVRADCDPRVACAVKNGRPITEKRSLMSLMSLVITSPTEPRHSTTSPTKANRSQDYIVDTCTLEIENLRRKFERALLYPEVVNTRALVVIDTTIPKEQGEEVEQNWDHNREPEEDTRVIKLFFNIGFNLVFTVFLF